MKETTNKWRRYLALPRDESGVALIVGMLLLTIFLCFGALAVDIGHLYIVRAELQNAADAAALAGANYFYPKIPSGAIGTAPTPDWSLAEEVVTTNAPPNKSENVVLTDYEVQSGYWNMARIPYGLQDQGITPQLNDAPAIRVTVRRTAGKNRGPVQNWFAAIFGKTTMDVSAGATAVCAFPGSVEPGVLLPVAISKEIADQAGTYNSPANPARIGSSYHYPNSMAGQWTSFQLDTNNVPTIRDLIANGNPTPLSIGDNIWIQPGTKTTLYSSVPVPADVVLPVVDAVLSDVTHSAVPIFGFVGFHITASLGGSKKYIEGYFIKDVYVGRSGPSGPYYGTYSPPRLVQ